MTKALEGVSIESASDLQTILRVNTYTSIANAYKRLEAMIPVFQSRMGALLFLISALLSRGLVCKLIRRLIFLTLQVILFLSILATASLM